MNWIHNIFRRVPAHEVLSDQLFEAERLHAEHLAAAEHHAALAGMYSARIARIRRTQTSAGELRAVK